MIFFRALRRIVWWGNRVWWWGRQRAGRGTNTVPKYVHPLDDKIMRQYTENRLAADFEVFCDLACIPLAFDIVTLLAAAEIHRRKVGANSFNVVFIIDATDPLPQFHRNENPVTKEKAYRILFNIGVLATHLFDKICDVTVFRSRKSLVNYWQTGRYGLGFFPTDYTPYHPVSKTVQNVTQYAPVKMLDYLKATGDSDPLLVVPENARVSVQEWLSKITDKLFIVTLTLRETPNVPERNACVSEWQKLVNEFSDQPIQFVVVRDYFAINPDKILIGENVIECREAVDDIVYRSALYEGASFNMLSNGGSALLCYMNPRIEFASFNVGLDADSARQEDMLVQWGLSNGGQLPVNGVNANKFRRLVWQRDEAPILIKTLLEALENIK